MSARTSRVNLVHVVNSPFFCDFYRMFQQLTGMLLDVRDIAGAQCSSFYREGDIQPFCQSMRSDPRSDQWCQHSSIPSIQAAVRTKRPVIYQCHAGYYNLAVPILVDSEPIGVIAAGPLLTSPRTAEQFEKMARRLEEAGFDLNRLRAEWLSAPVRDEETLRIGCDLLFLVANYVAHNEQRLRTLAQGAEHPAVTAAKQYLDRHFEHTLNLNAVARTAHTSPHYLCRLFKAETGFGLREYLHRVRMEKAKELLLTTGRSIEEIAYAAGFKSQSHFCRLFKRYMRVTPGQFRGSR